MTHIWNTFTAAPHRVMFLGGVVQLVAAIAWWSVELAARYAGTGVPVITPLYATWDHAWLMLLGLFPFFMFGFLMTTYPRWMGGAAVARRDYLGAFLALFGGVCLFYAGLHGGVMSVAAGLALHGLGFGWGVYALWRVYRQVGPARSRQYETQLNVALLLGLASDVLFLAWVIAGDGRLLQAAITGALWLFLIPVLVLVGHRMIPFFSNAALSGYTVVQPQWSFPLLWFSVAIHFLMELLDARGWLWLPDGALLFLAMHHSVRWQWRRALANPLLGALHVAFAFLSFGLMLSVLQSAWLLATGEVIMTRAPLHAIAVGFIGGMTVAMVTRVSRGHSGRPLVMGWLDRVAFGAVSLAALVRVAAEVAPGAASLSLAAAVVWIVGLGPWVARYLPVYLLPRPDGEPG